jgi:hypothetical protein
MFVYFAGGPAFTVKCFNGCLYASDVKRKARADATENEGK